MFPLSIKDYIILGFVIAVLLMGYHLYSAGKKNGAAEVTTKSLTEASNVKGKQDEAANNRPDNSALTGILHKHKF